jgi:hypothetical protein
MVSDLVFNIELKMPETDAGTQILSIKFSSGKLATQRLIAVAPTKQTNKFQYAVT